MAMAEQAARLAQEDKGQQGKQLVGNYSLRGLALA